MLRRHLVALAVISAVAASFAACGGDSDSDGKGGSGATEGGVGGAAGGVTDPAGDGKIPPVKPEAPPAAGTEDTVLAINQLFLGDTDRNGVLDLTYQAWKKFGFNLDGLMSTAKGTNHCKPVEGAIKTNVQPDGDDGIDNAFGASLVPVLGALAGNLSETATEAIDEGSFTIMLKLEKLEAKPDQTAINTLLYGGADMGVPPNWDGNDEWPVLPELLNGGDINNPKVKFTDSYMAGGVWVSGSAGTLNLSLSVSGIDLTLKIEKALIAMKITGTGSGASATDGTIGGVLPTEQFIAELKKVAAPLLNSCDSSTVEAIATQVRQASDIMQDGTNGDPTKTCDGISIGLGFNAKAVKLGVVAPVSEPPDDPCADGG
jgi:hypothetical protein